MYIARSRSASPLFLAIVALLLTSTLCVGADDDKTKKNNTAAQSKPAPKSKSVTPGSSGKSSSSSGSSSTGTRSSGNTGRGSSGSSTSVGGTSTTGDAGHKHNKTGSNDTNTTSTSSGANTSVRSGHKHDTNSGSTNTTVSGGTGNKEHKHATDGGSSTTSTGSNAGTTGGSSTSHSGKHDKNRTTDTAGSTSGSATSTTTTTTNSKGKKHDSTNATGDADGKVGVNTASAHPGFVRAANGKPELYRGRDGSEARFRRDGSIREVHTRDMTIIHRPGGSRTVIVERPDRSRIVVNRFGHGYVQRPFLYRNHEFYNRTYYYRGRPYALYYRGYPYRGVVLHGYVPYRYYSPAFYGWAYRPWYRPVRYNWGWFGSPWYGYYGRYYFTPYSVYPSATFWLTDFLIATSLQAAYEERLAGQASYYSSAPSGSVVLSPEVKDAISNEVQRQLALENAESRIATSGDLDMNSSGLPRMLAEASPSNPRIFVVVGALDVTNIQGQECTLTEGDVLRLSSPPGTDASFANLEVLATKNQSCPKGTTVSVGFADLQEMQNHMRATIDRGLQDLQEHQGGLPAPPLNAASAPVQASFAPIAPPPDPNVTSELQSQALEADAADRQILTEVKQADKSITSGTSEPAEISLGQTMSEVEAILGKPNQVVNLGSKKMYVYPSMKITFIDGKVSDVE